MISLICIWHIQFSVYVNKFEPSRICKSAAVQNLYIKNISKEFDLTWPPSQHHNNISHHDHGHDHGHGLKHFHDEDMQSIAIRHDGDVNPNKFMPWLNQLTQALGPSILRCKGIVAMKGDPQRFVFQGVHMMLDGEPQREWGADEKRVSKLVFIGRDLDEGLIRKGFLGCVA